jgi:hypothetical protein
MLLKITFPAKHMELSLWYIYTRSTEKLPEKMAERKRGATNFDCETPEK